MRVVICGDTHVGAVFGLGKKAKDGVNTRVRDYESSLNHIIDYCISEKVDVFVQTGDVFDSRNPLPEHMKIVDSAARRLSNAGISTIIMMGNHDYKRSGKDFSSSISLLASKDYSNVRMVLTPEIIEVSNGSDSVNIFLMPYRDKRMYDGDSCERASLGYNNHVKSLLSDIKNDNPVVAIGHNFYFEGSYNDFGGSEVLADIGSFSECDLIAMGHQHNFRIVRKKNPIAIYTGSMEKLNFGDAAVDKYFIDYDSINKKINMRKVPARNLCDCEMNLVGVRVSEIDKAIDDELDKLNVEGSIVRMRILISESITSSISKSYVENKIYSMGAFYVSKVLVEPISERIIRDLSVLTHKDDYLMFEAFVSSQGIKDTVEIKILEHAKNIIG
jgi:exonuclease SbcD